MVLCPVCTDDVYCEDWAHSGTVQTGYIKCAYTHSDNSTSRCFPSTDPAWNEELLSWGCDATHHDSGSATIWNTEFTLSAQNVVIMVLVILNFLTIFGVICNCLQSRVGGVVRRVNKYQVVSMNNVMAEDSNCDERELFENNAV